MNPTPATFQTATELTKLEAAHPGKTVLIHYRHSNGDRDCGELLTAYPSLAGHHVAQIGSFANWVHLDQITAYHLE